MCGGGRQGADRRLHLWAVLVRLGGDAMIKKRVIFQIEGDRSTFFNTRGEAEAVVDRRFKHARDRMFQKVKDAQKLIETSEMAEDEELEGVARAFRIAGEAIEGYITARKVRDRVREEP
jgi:hypothetical protein